MHMSNVLLSPLVGSAFLTISGALAGYSSGKMKQEKQPALTPLMGTLGAFVFAAQMINVSIPATGSSGHLGGGLLLAALLGLHRAFLAMSLLLTLQSVLFADGGLLALGCNIFNMAFIPAFIAYPLIFKTLTSNNNSPNRLAVASIIAALAGVLMGALAVTLQTAVSGISALPFTTFAAHMLPIHAAIGVAEGVITWAVLTAVRLQATNLPLHPNAAANIGSVKRAFVMAALLIGGVGSWFASAEHDGLEWSIARTFGSELPENSSALHNYAAAIQEQTALFPDYAVPFAPSTTTVAGVAISLESTIAALIGIGVMLLLTARKQAKG
uniref:Cobalamin biosynthesis protein CbiM, putative n=1 Tax=Chlorobium chlorochromatii (strain CaD3) TaxID=340177 RepID=Q3AT45_CHLCH